MSFRFQIRSRSKRNQVSRNVVWRKFLSFNQMSRMIFPRWQTTEMANLEYHTLSTKRSKTSQFLCSSQT
ncbi:hypothetical protein MAR_035011, partial [Mya arenaria]